jgi:hypothetical protein
MTPILHIEHPEDSVLTGDLSFLDAIRNRGVLSVKMDGAPAIVWGMNPATGNFFVGTKSVFNKVKIKINESHQDIDKNHTGEVATILHKCFDYLPLTDGIFQGDFIGLGGSDEYTPNTITYKFDNIVTEEIIVAPHTYYTAESDLRDAIAHPMNFIITDTFYCKIVQPRAYVWSGSYCSLDEQFELPPAMTAVMSLLPTVQFVTDKEAAQIRINVNRSLREGRDYSAADFLGNVTLMHLYSLVQFIKEECLSQCRVLNGPEAYINQDRIDAEGYVYSYEGKVYKLVNRKQFSVANFNNTKFEQLVAV